MPHAAAITPMEMATTCAKTRTAGFMARKGEGRGVVCTESYVPPTVRFPSWSSGAGRCHPADRRVGVLRARLARRPLLAQKPFHRGLSGDGFGDLVAHP